MQNLRAGVVSPHTHSIRIYSLTRFSGDLHSLSSLSSPGSHTFLARPVALHLLQSVLWFCSLHRLVLFKAVDFIWVWQLRSGPHPLQRAVYRRYPWALGCLRGGSGDQESRLGWQLQLPAPPRACWQGHLWGTEPRGNWSLPL